MNTQKKKKQTKKIGGKRREEAERIPFDCFIYLFFLRILEKNHSRKPSDCGQDRPGMLFVALWILIYIGFLILVVSRHSIFCWLVWTVKATSCTVEIGSLLVCHVLVFILFNATDSI